MSAAGPLLVALALDVWWGEPPPGLHPVVWMGQVLARVEGRAPRPEPARLVYGAAAGILLPLTWAWLGWRLESRLPWPIQALFLKPTFAGAALHAAARRVEDHLRNGQLDLARQELRWLVSRPTHDLDAGLVAAATIESLAENFVDSWLAPLAAYAQFGLAGAYAYRAANTADAMWGYHSADYEWLGKTVARLDDLLNWLPARLGALVLMVVGLNPRRARRVWWREAGRTSSPNAGQSMAAAAGQLGVRLEKRAHYVLNADARVPDADDIAAARSLVARAMVVSAGMCLILRTMVRR